VQGQTSPGAHVDQGQLLPLSIRRGQRGHQSGAAADLVHLIAVGGGQFEQPIAVIETEAAVLGAEAPVQRRLRLIQPGKPVAQRLGCQLQHQEGRGGLEQQRWQLLGRDEGGNRQ
jgi:hypothetical protein